MKVCLAPAESEPAVMMECDCGEKFWVDPCDEENLVLLPSERFGHALFAKCPTCGKVEDPK